MSAYVFLSYSSTDRAYAEWIHEALTSAGIPCWFDQELVSGDRWEQVLRERVDGCSGLVVMMSKTASESMWVRLEVGRARVQDRPVHPLTLDGTLVDWLRDIQYERLLDDGVLPVRLLERLRTIVAAPAPRPRQSGPPVLAGRGLPMRNPHFVGRAEALLVLETQLYWDPAVPIRALHGTGGVGKTQLAAEYVHRHIRDYDLTGWIDAEHADLIEAQLAELAPAVGIATAPGASVRAVAAQAVAALGLSDMRWLLVFDNAQQPQTITAFLPRGGCGHVIVTTRMEGWSAVGKPIDVDVLPRAESVALLRARCSTVDDMAADTICEALGDLPLAVEQAGAYLAAANLTPAKYLELLSTRGTALLTRGRVAGHAHTVATTWDVSRRKLADAGKVGAAATVLLQVCAFLGAEPIPLSIFTVDPSVLPSPLNKAAADPVRFADTVAALLTYGLAGGGADQQSLSVHRLLATVVRDHVAGERRDEARELHAAIGALWSGAPAEPMTNVAGWPTWAALVPHVRAAIGHLPERHRNTTALALADRAATYLRSQGQLSAAVALFEAALAGRTRIHGPDHRNTLASSNNLAGAYRAAGRVSEAVPLYESTLQACTRILGAEHPDTLNARNNLASACRSAGQLDRAMALAEEAVAGCERVHGPDHPDTLTARNNLARSYRSAGRLERAIEIYESTLAGRLRVLGPDHPDTLTSRHNLAYAYHVGRRLDEALPMLEENLRDRERVLGAANPETLTSRHVLAHAYDEAGEPDRARDLYESTLEDRLRILGPSHPDTLASRHSLAHAYESAGQVDRALRLYEALLVDCLRILGDDDPFTRAVQASIMAAQSTTSPN
ncbi:MAG TPA: FxSxx-COOH system tetratricopeptide repeat protein [Micromonosporaceae bacterium]